METTPVPKKLRSGEQESIESRSDAPYQERTKAELLDSLKNSMEQVLAGDYRPALEVLDAIDSESSDDANDR